MASFNLLDRPWIPVVVDGQVNTIQEVSIRDALVHAHEIRAIDAPSPIATAAIHRLLFAVLHRALSGPKDGVAWDRLRRVGQFDSQPILDYCATWHDRFDLFDEHRPFYQAPMLQAFPGSRKAASQLTFSRTSDRNKPLMWDRSLAETVIPCAEAAIGLVTTQAYATGGLVSYDDPAFKSARGAPLVGVGVWIVLERTLFATLCANLLPYAADPRDQPAWEHDMPPLTGRDRMPVGRCDWLTWQQRRMLLIPSADDTVAQVVHMRGDQIPVPPPPAKGEEPELAPNPWFDDVQVVPDARRGAMSPHGSSIANCLGKALESLPVLARQDGSQPVMLRCSWAVTMQAKYIAWRSSLIVMPQRIVQNRHAWVSVLESASLQMEALEPFLSGSAIQMPAGGTRESPMRALIRRAPQCASERDAAPIRYWRDIDTEYRVWLQQIAEGLFTPEEAAIAWSIVAQNVARSAYLGSLIQVPNVPDRQEVVEQLLDGFDVLLALVCQKPFVQEGTDATDTP